MDLSPNEDLAEHRATEMNKNVKFMKWPSWIPFRTVDGLVSNFGKFIFDRIGICNVEGCFGVGGNLRPLLYLDEDKLTPLSMRLPTTIHYNMQIVRIDANPYHFVEQVDLVNEIAHSIHLCHIRKTLDSIDYVGIDMSHEGN